MGVNTEKVITLLGEVNKAFGTLEKYSRLEKAALLGDDEKLAAIKYHFVVMLEACIDLCIHISARSFVEAPEGYAHCFELLGRHGLLSPAVAGKMAELARFRNLLVHLYWKVDDSRVVEILQSELAAVKAFVSAIATATSEPQNE